jgi:selenide,water dikinase
LAQVVQEEDERLLVGTASCEDAAVLQFPPSMALVQTLDFFTPIVNDPFAFGQIAAANALSDVYAMGGRPYSVMNIVCFPLKSLPKEMLVQILRGGLDKIREAGAVMAGGHSIEDQELKYGLSVSGVVDPDSIAVNNGAKPGDQLLLTKPLGTGVLATAIKADWQGKSELESLLIKWAARLNKTAGEVISSLKLKGATDVTGFGLGGHVLEMARASKVDIEIWPAQVPIIEKATELATMGLIPAGSYANKHYCSEYVQIDQGVDTLLADLVFDAQTSGGMVLSVPEEQVSEACSMLSAQGELSVPIGRVLEMNGDRPVLYLV